MKLSDVLKMVNLDGFTLSGNLQADLFSYCKENSIDVKADGNIVAYRLSFGESLTVHTLTDGVSKRVINTRIDDLPVELPEALKRSFLFEAKVGSVLFDDIIALGGFLLDGDLVLVSAYQDGHTYWQHEKGAYDGRNLRDIQFDLEPDKEVYGKEMYDRATRKDTFAFITVLALMLEAERTPISVDSGSKKARKRQGNSMSSNSGWVERRIYIDAKYCVKQENKDHLSMDKDGKVKREVFIRGFLRNQPYGPEHSLRKWIYVEGFESSRWTKEGDKKITMDLRSKGMKS